jgi:quercetin dioxygenase-like cupin family protein
MGIRRVGTQPSAKGPSDWFTGTVRIDPAAPTTAMTHIAIQEKKDGKVVDWMEHVTDEQCRKRAG